MAGKGKFCIKEWGDQVVIAIRYHHLHLGIAVHHLAQSTRCAHVTGFVVGAIWNWLPVPTSTHPACGGEVRTIHAHLQVSHQVVVENCRISRSSHVAGRVSQHRPFGGFVGFQRQIPSVQSANGLALGTE